MSKNIYYTYAWLREDRTPYYIGKGCGKRAFDRRRKFCPSNDRILILKKDLSEHEAFKHEVYMISVFGRKDIGTGILYNFTDGGDGVSGYKHTEETKLKLAEFGRNQSPYIRSEETKEKLSESLRSLPPHSAERREKISKALTGKVQSEETKKKRADKLRGRKRSEEVKRKISQAHLGKVQGPPSKETREKISLANKGKKRTEETRAKISEAMKGKRKRGHSEKTKKNISETMKKLRKEQRERQAGN